MACKIAWPRPCVFISSGSQTREKSLSATVANICPFDGHRRIHRPARQQKPTMTPPPAASTGSPPWASPQSPPRTRRCARRCAPFSRRPSKTCRPIGARAPAAGITPPSPPPPPAGDEALRPQVRAFLAQAIKDLPPHRRARSWGGHDAAFSRALGQRGWLGIALPRAYGGAGRSPFARYVLVEEFLNFGAPVGAHWIADRQSGPLILKYGTEAQKQFYLPRICRGEAFFCIGMSEPGAGSDLASVK